MNTREETRTKIMEIVSGALNQRIRPFELERKLEREHSLALSTIKHALRELVDARELVYTYRDPCTYVEIPVTESARAERPLTVPS
jgi:hypothetical protein